MARRQYSAECKHEAVALVQAGNDLGEVAQSLGISHGSLWNWVAQANGRTKRPGAGAAVEQPPVPVDPAAYQAALKRIAELEREVDLLGKASASCAGKAHRETRCMGSWRSRHLTIPSPGSVRCLA